MSLVVCRREGDLIMIVSDTKLQYPEDFSLPGVNVSNINSGNPLDGTIKTIIINKHVCVSFAGETAIAQQVLQKISTEIELDRLLELVILSSKSNETDFLICCLNPSRVFKIQAGAYSEETQTCWIGSKNGFAKFQGYFLNQIPPITVGTSSISFEPVISTSKDSAFNKISSAFDNVILDPEVDSVGGFKVIVASTGGAFSYKGYNKRYGGSTMIDFSKMDEGVHYPLKIGSASDGSYSIHFFHSLKNLSVVAVHVREGPFGIIYQRKGAGLLAPSMYKKTESDFATFTKSNFGVVHGMETQQKESSLNYLFEGSYHYDRQNYEQAIQSFDKVISSSDDNKERRGLAYYKKAMAFEKLDKKKEALIELNSAVLESPRLNEYAEEFRQRLIE